MKLNFSINTRVGQFIRSFIMADVLLFAGWGFVDPIFSVFLVRQIGGATLVTVGIAVAIYWVLKSVLQIPIALYLDKTDGERDDFYALIAALIVIGISAFGFAMSKSVWQVYLSQVVKALGFSFYVPAFSSLFAGHLDKRHRSLDYALDSTFVGFGMGAAGLFGGVLATWVGYDSVFMIAGILSFCSAAVLLAVPHLVLPPKKREGEPEMMKDHDRVTVER